MRLLLTLVVGVGVVFGVSRARAGRAETDLWHEATDPARPRTATPGT